MKMIKKTGALLLAVLLVLSLGASAFADNTYSVNGDASSCTFEKYLVMNNDATVPNVTFAFTIEAGTAIPSANGTFEVLAGPGSPSISAGQAAFTSTDSTTPEAQAGENRTIAFQTADTSDEKFAVKTVTVDFSGVSFDEPGVYRYIIKESAATYTGVTIDSNDKRTLDVYVIDNNGTLEVSEYVLHTGTAAPAAGSNMGTADVATEGARLSDKSSGFTNLYATRNLTFGKEVTGNQGSKNKYFAFTLSLENAIPGTVYNVDLSLAEATSGSNSATIAANAGKTNPATITAGSDGKATAVFYLHDGQYVTVKGVAKGTAYALTENAEDYLSTEKIASSVSSYEVSGAAVALQDAVSGTIADAAVLTGYTNTRDGVIPTGVMMTAIPGIAIVLLAAFGLAFLGRKKNSQA